MKKTPGNVVVVSILLVSILALSSCATLGPAYQKVDKIPDNMGLVYIYRPSHFTGGGMTYDVKSGEDVIISLYNGGYYPYFAKPGVTEFWAKTEARSSVSLVVKAGRTYYIRGTVGWGLFIARPYLEMVPPNIGENEIKDCKLIPEKKESVVLEQQ